MLLVTDRLGIATEGHTKEVASKRDQDRSGHLGAFFFLPWADVIRFHGLVGISVELHRCHVPAQLRNSKFNLAVGQHIAGLCVQGLVACANLGIGLCVLSLQWMIPVGHTDCQAQSDPKSLRSRFHNARSNIWGFNG
jgi:hypothetical protein